MPVVTHAEGALEIEVEGEFAEAAVASSYSPQLQAGCYRFAGEVIAFGCA